MPNQVLLYSEITALMQIPHTYGKSRCKREPPQCSRCIFVQRRSANYSALMSNWLCAGEVKLEEESNDKLPALCLVKPLFEACERRVKF